MEAVISLRRSVRFGFAVALGLVCGCMEGNAGSSRNVPINEISIECGGGKIGDASEELSKHLSLVAGSKFVSAMQNSALTIVLGVKAPGEGETADFTSYAKLVGDKLYLWGDDREDRPGTLFAVYGFLETILGVVWPMPGDDNIVAPAADRLNIPQNWSWRYCPPLKSGMMRGGDLQRKRLFDRRGDFAPMALRRTKEQIIADRKNISRWKLRQKMFIRENILFGHAFGRWNSKYIKTHPEYLALQPNGERGTSSPMRNQRHMKLCVSNEAVVDQIVRDYIDAGKPKYYNVCPNDGGNFCRCEKCRALDCPQTEDERTMKTLLPGTMTDRYVNFWNRIARKLTAIRPDVMISTYIYYCYRDPPRRERIEYPDNMCFGMVPSAEDDNLAMIRGWKAKGMKHFKLRPNYLCYSGWMMRGRERFYFENFKMNYREGMFGVDYDGSPRGDILAFECYAIARVMQNPDIDFETVEREFLSIFGKAAEKMKVFFDRIRLRNEKALVAKQKMNASEKEMVLDDSELVKTVQRANSTEVLMGDIKLLDEVLADPDLSPNVRKRIERMRILVEHAILTSDFMNAWDRTGTGRVAPDFVEKGMKLVDFRVNKVAPVIEPFNWGNTFRKPPVEAQYWLKEPLWSALKAKYPEIEKSPKK